MKTISKVYVGVDVSKDTLDIHFHPTERFFKIANSKEGIRKLIKELNKYNIEQIACEATGGYEKLLAQLLRKSPYTLWIVDPRRIRGFIIATGCKSKTDKIDAQKIAEFASKNSLDYKVIIKTEHQERLQALVNRKQDLTKFLAAEKTRLQHPSHQLCILGIKKFIKVFGKEIKKIDQQIQNLIENNDKLHVKSKQIESIPGIGKATAALLVSFVPELGQLNNGQISAIVGLCPFDNSSGKYKGKKFIRGGRIVPRNALYMCALTAIKCNPILKQFYDQLRAREKPFKVALIAVMHKLIMFANSLLKKGEMYKVCN